MAERPPPESIRGSWYYLPASLDPHNLGDKPPQVLRFRLDGGFTRYIARDDGWIEKEKGDYTFDGAFLIVRGRNTDTFRVRIERYWRWSLEGKKEEQVLLRGLVTDADFGALDAEDQKEIRILPIRVSVRARSDTDDAVFDLVYKGESGERLVGSFFVEREDAKVWVGVSPFVEGIESKTWERIIRESYLDIFRGKPRDVRVVTVRLLENGDSRVFNYSI